jgi:hypothetical protein
MDCYFGIGAGCAPRASSLPNQGDGAAGFGTEIGAPITVVGMLKPPKGKKPKHLFEDNDSRIDGFSFTGGDTGGGIFVNGYAHGLEISNNHVFGNNGLYSGGIRVGRPFLELTEDQLDEKEKIKGKRIFAFNKDIDIHNNSITQNGGLGGAGGGLSICSGTDEYNVSGNFICGNFTTGDGGGIGHLGFSEGGVIVDNRILFNQSFNQGFGRSGGGLIIAGEAHTLEDAPIQDDIIVRLNLGSGSVEVNANLIQGNHAGAGHGGGIRTQFVNGTDVVGEISEKKWHTITIKNNMIVNNVAGWSGGGVSLQDTAHSIIISNTIANNDATATVSDAFVDGIAMPSTKQPAGISSAPHSGPLKAAIPNGDKLDKYRDFSNPTLANNIVWQNRSFHYDAAGASGAGLVPILGQAAVGDCDATANYWDLGVLGGGFTLNPVYSVLTDTTGYPGDGLTSADPELVNAYCNGSRALLAPFGPMQALPALDEGGVAWIDVRFGPLENLPWDYHIGATSSAFNAGNKKDSAKERDYDDDQRPQEVLWDIGADELVVAPTP